MPAVASYPDIPGARDRPGHRASHAPACSSSARRKRSNNDQVNSDWMVTSTLPSSTCAERLFFQLVGSFAKFERRQIAERTASGGRVKASRGGYAGGDAPIGYRAERG